MTDLNVLDNSLPYLDTQYFFPFLDGVSQILPSSVQICTVSLVLESRCSGFEISRYDLQCLAILHFCCSF